MGVCMDTSLIDKGTMLEEEEEEGEMDENRGLVRYRYHRGRMTTTSTWPCWALGHRCCCHCRQGRRYSRGGGVPSAAKSAAHTVLYCTLHNRMESSKERTSL